MSSASYHASVAVRPRIDFEQALASASPLLELRQAVSDEINLHGMDRDEVFAVLLEEMLMLRDAGRDEDEEVVTSVMDFMEGWSSSAMRI